MDYGIIIEGGGIGGIIPATVLYRLDDANPGFVKGAFGFAGTSTGALIAAALAYGLAPQFIADIYRNCGGACFTRDLMREAGEGIFRAKWDGVGLRQVCCNTLGRVTMRDVRPLVIVAAIWPGKTKVAIHNAPGSPFLDWSLVDAVLASSAAPGYFPGHVVDGVCYVDGGLVDNLPGPDLLDKFPNVKALIALTTGQTPLGSFSSNPDRGFMSWGVDLLDCETAGPVSSAKEEMEDRLGPGFVMVDFPVGDYYMDDATAIPRLGQAALDANIEDPSACCGQIMAA